MKWMTRQSIILAFALALVVWFANAFPSPAESAQGLPQDSQVKLSAVESVTINGEGDTAELVIKLSAPATYTSYKTTSPLRLVIDLSQTTQGKISAPVALNKGNFKTVTVNRYDTDAGVLTRIDVELAKDADPVLSTSQEKPGEIRVTFPALAAQAASKVQVGAETKGADIASSLEKTPSSEQSVPSVPVSEPSPVAQTVARTLEGVSVKDDSIVLAIQGGVEEFKTIRLDNPDRYVVDLYGVKNSLASRIIPIKSNGVSSARLGLYPDKVRVVFELVNGKGAEPNAVKSADGLLILLKREEKTASAPPVSDNVKEKDQEPVVNPQSVAKEEAAPKAAEVTSQLSVKPSPQAVSAKKDVRVSPARVEMIDFQIVNGVTRVSVKVAGNAIVDAPEKTPGFVTLTIKNAALPPKLQHSLETKKFVSPVLRVTPILVKTRKGADTKIRIAMRMPATYEYRQEGDMLFIDFKNPEGMSADSLSPDLQEIRPARTARKPDSHLNAELLSHGDATVKSSSSQKIYKGRRVTLEFADAEVRKIFQLLSEVSNKNFVLGDDVTGTISIKLVNVPWDQALDIILDTKGLDKREEGNIVIIKAKGKFKSQAEEDRELKRAQLKATELETRLFTLNYANPDDILTQFKLMLTDGVGASVNKDIRTNKIIVNDIPQAIKRMGEILKELDVPEKQVMIEARIVEASSSFVSDLGVNWGIHYNDPSGSLIGITGLDTGFGGLTTAPPTTGTGTRSGGDLGITFGALGDVALSVRLSAAATAGLIKIVSSPKIATLNNKTAKILQGQQIPYVAATSDKVETKFIEAALSLEVTPHINPDGTISMKIDAKNDSKGETVSGSNAPAINKKEATTEMLLKDGETMVIGGIFQDDDETTDEGVPYFMDIPVVGKLFKKHTKTKNKTELLVFITPRILG